MTINDKDADSTARSDLAAFLAAHTTLTLATVGPDGAPAAAAVFYAHDDDLNLYFLSEEKTLHARNILANPQVAAAIHADRQDWRFIQGVQVCGRASLLAGRRAAHAAAIYGRKFAFVGALLAGAEGPAALSGPLAKARFWRLTPAWLRLIDNTQGFGHKVELELNQDVNG